MVDILLNNESFLNIVVKTRGRFSFVPLVLSNSIALIEVKDELHSPSYEVWILRLYKGKGFSNVWNHIFPSDEDFGSYGWSFSDKVNAEAKFNSLLLAGSD